MADGKVVVITGASSGMGRAAAERFAKRGDKLVLCARRAGLLEEVAGICRRTGGEALAVPADVTDAHAVEEVAQQALAQYGRIDAWVHAAAVASYGKLEETPVETIRRTVDVILVGSMIVAREATRRFRDQGRGTLVLISSVLAETPLPYLTVYNAAKHGVRGLATSLRADLKEEGLGDDIRVVNLMPPSTDTPFYIHAANHVGRVPRPPPPVYDVWTLADAIVDAVDDPKDEVTVGAIGKLMVASNAVAPGLYEKVTGPYTKTMFLDEAAPVSNNAAFDPMPEGRTEDGGWKAGTMLEKRGRGGAH